MDLKELRESKGFRLRDIAYIADVTEVTVRNWEVGKTLPKLRFDQVIKLCTALDCSVEDLQKAVENTKKHEE